ncbi:MAG TPA: leucyl aminopeptidase [Mycobacteriales bacterium]|nr:leucyl aminopeptidase [Mycobacteriales bacterium]
MTTLSLTTSAAPSLQVDAVVIGVVPGRKGVAVAPGGQAVADAVGKPFLAALTGLGATGKRGTVTCLATLGAIKPAVVVAVGLGADAAEDGADLESLRRAAGDALRALAGSARTVGLSLVDPAAATPEQVRAVAEGALLGAYRFTAYRTTPDLPAPVEQVQVVVDKKVAKDSAVKDAARRAEVVARATTLARDLVNTPPSDLHPADLADRAEAEAKRVGISVEVLDHKALAKGGYGGITGVGQGSVNPPRLVHLSYRGGKRGGPKVALVGKGITFDSGGLSLKPATAMEDMKSDMGGAAAVIAATAAVAELGLAVDLDAWVPMAENMPSGTAIRPSDVLTMRGGKTVEVNNTDAEGRLILADAIVRACEDEPDVLLDAATLTGAQLVALGARTAGVMGNDDALRERVVDAAVRAGESMWPMPLPPELKKGLDSEVADLLNTGPREGGMLTAGLFLQEFVADGVKWAHLDIAGPAYNPGEAYGYTPHGGTGAAVRTFVQVVEDLTRTAL